MGKAMRYTSAEKVEIIRLVEESDLSVKRTLDGLRISRSTFYRWYGEYCEHGEGPIILRHRGR